MPPAAGDTIGSYAIERELGRGGMGVVYLGRDTRLHRSVAIKALPAHLALDPDRLSRFEREARTLAQLNHPNIAGIHGIEELDGTRYLVLEFVDGQTLAELVDRGPVPVDEAIEIAVQLAAGIEGAHEAGVIHRDLKPGNIIITPSGQVKILDFGLAKAVDAPGSSSQVLTNSPTVTTPVMHSPTIPGAIMGTAPYMSPEQARGRTVDRRTDVWSFGVILYEMLTGESPFRGETATDSIGAILHKEIDLTALPLGTPASVVRVLTQCLQRDKANRFRDIGDVRLELLGAHKEPAPAVAPMRPQRSLALPIGVVAIILGALAGWFGAMRMAPEPTRPVRKFDLEIEAANQQFEFQEPVISPDGTHVAYILDNDIRVRDLGSFETRTVAHLDQPGSMAWSPDSRQLAVSSKTGLYKIGLADGAISDLSRQLTDHFVIGNGWTADGRIIHGDENGIYEMSAQGGPSTDILRVNDETEVDFHNPVHVPGSNVILFIQHNRNQTFVLQATDGKRRETILDLTDPPITRCSYAPSGHILFSRGWGETTLWAVPFDVSSMRATGTPFLVLSDASIPSVSNDGTLSVFRGPANLGGQMALYGMDGAITRIGEPRKFLLAPLLSHDGTRIAYSTGRSPDKTDIWIYDRERGTNTRLTFDETMCICSGWSPDDSEVATIRFTPAGKNLLITSFYHSDGSGPSRDPINTGLMSFDGAWKYAATEPEPGAQNREIRAVPLDDPTAMTPVVRSERVDGGALISPDGAVILYSSSESGDRRLYCTTFPSGQGKWLIADAVVMGHGWSRDGSTIYFTTADKRLMKVAVERKPSLRFGVPELVLDFAGRQKQDIPELQRIDPTADGSAFLAVLHDTEDTSPNRISIIENWFEEFRAGAGSR